MGEKIVVGPINHGLRTDREPFVIDNDSFPVLINAYQWRGRIKRKRGTSFLGRLTRYFDSTNISYTSTSTFALVAGAGNLLTGFSLQANGNIIPGSVTITDTNTGDVYTDTPMNGTLLKNGVADPGSTINYASGAITIAGGGADLVSASFLYYPDLPVMGLRDFVMTSSAFPGTIAFDTVYSYNILTTTPHNIYDVSFYKNPPADPTNLPGYVPKTNVTPTTWNGADYQQFWTINYQGAMWATNGINIPFNPANVGMQFKDILTVTVLSPTTASLQITAHGLVVGDFVFINEVVGTTGINFQTGYVTTVTDVNNVIVTFPFAVLATNGTGGIAQYLTNRSDVTKDSLRWYDGDPTDGLVPPGLTGQKGWVNFSPPLSQGTFSIAEAPQAIYYLVGARMIVNFKDRLLFIGPVIQTKAPGSQIYLQDTVIYSQNGTPYYTASYTNSPNAAIDTPVSITNIFHPILVPTNQTAISPAYFEDQTGFGGFASAGIDEPINTVSQNEDVLIMGFDTNQARFVYTGTDLIPFNFFLINSELGSSSTFTAINFDKGVSTRGSRGYIMTSQTEARRMDVEIPDQVFEVNLLNNGTERMTAQRDFINEWIYFTYPSNKITYRFPNQTLQYNYRDDSWAIFDECYTTYGNFRERTGFTWATIGQKYPTWDEWNDPWGAGASAVLQPNVIAGNQQGFVIQRNSGTDETTSLYIQNVTSTTVTSPDHCLNEGDYIIISGVIGTIGTEVNGKIFSVAPPITDNSFTLNPTVGTGTYVGGGLITRMSVPFIQTRQFPVAWGMSRKTRLGVQQYLITTTDDSQITLLIYLSQNADDPYNDGPIVPDTNVDNNSLIYSTVLYTCPESTNLGLTPANTNLQMPTAVQQAQIWHRINTSLIGDTVQLGFTLNDVQMRAVDDNGNTISQFSEIELHGIILDCSASSLLA